MIQNHVPDSVEKNAPLVGYSIWLTDLEKFRIGNGVGSILLYSQKLPDGRYCSENVICDFRLRYCNTQHHDFDTIDGNFCRVSMYTIVFCFLKVIFFVVVDIVSHRTRNLVSSIYVSSQ